MIEKLFRSLVLVLVLMLLAPVVEAPGVKSHRETVEQPALPGKVPPPLSCRLRFDKEPKVGPSRSVCLEIRNQFHAGTLRIRLDVPEPLRVGGELEQPRPRPLALGEEKEIRFPIAMPAEGQYRLQAVVSLKTAQGGEVSASTFLVIGVPQVEASPLTLWEATRPNGQRLRVHRDTPPIREPR